MRRDIMKYKFKYLLGIIMPIFAFMKIGFFIVLCILNDGSIVLPIGSSIIPCRPACPRADVPML